MTDAEAAREILHEYFANVTADEYERDVRQYSPEAIEGEIVDEDKTLAELGLPGLVTDATSSVVAIRSSPSHTPLDAYLACALTGLSPEQRQLMEHMSDTISVVCSELDISLYEPRKKTDPVHHPTVPDAEVFRIDRERVQRSDLLIYLAHYPSTGAGEELDFAYNAMVPIVVVHHSTSRVSRMVTGIPGLVLTLNYESPEELRTIVKEALAQLRPQLVQRKLAFSDYDVNIVGDRVRRLRESQGLTREQVAARSSSRSPISPESIAQLEESTDRDSNPSLLMLREIATILGTTVSDLVEPDFEQTVLTLLSSWISGHQAARFGNVSVRDRNKLLRKLLLRLIDNLENDE